MVSENYFGIDFGTTTSAVVGCSMLGNASDQFKYGDDEGRPFPSVIAIDKKTGEVFTGRDAWDKKSELSESCQYISSVKTLLDSDSVWEIDGKSWTPVLVASELFKALKKEVYCQTGRNLNKATVAIPIGFNVKKRDRLREAAQIAGVEIDSFVSEPTAAFFANYNELKSSSVVAVFDWGGGTLDVSVIKNEGGNIFELATGGLDVAGDDIDQKIARRIHNKIARKKGMEIAFDDMAPKARDVMLVRAERAKRGLCDDDTATISINNYGKYGVCKETLDYDWFADIIEPEVNMAIECLQKTIDRSGVGLANIDRIVMVGGSSNLGPLLDKMEPLYGDKLFFPEETMWNVAQGASRLAMTPGAYFSNQSVGIVLSDGNCYNFLEPGTSLNRWSTSCRLGIVETGDYARFVFTGSKDIDESSEKLRVLYIPAYGYLEEQIEVQAFVDKNMIFRVLAKSAMRSENFQRVWEYPELKCYYKLPERY